MTIDDLLRAGWNPQDIGEALLTGRIFLGPTPGPSSAPDGNRPSLGPSGAHGDQGDGDDHGR